MARAVLACLADSIQWIQSMRAMVVVASRVALAGGDAVSTSSNSGGTLGSASLYDGEMSSLTDSPLVTPASFNCAGTLNQ